MADINKTIKDLDEQIAWIQDNDFHKFPGWGHAVLAMKDAIELLKEQKAEYPVCEKCGKEIEHINTSVFSYDGSDSDRSIPITYSKENGCVLFSTNQNWTGYDLTEEERKDRIRCPHCGKFPFNNSTKIEVHIPLTVDVMMWTSESR